MHLLKPFKGAVLSLCLVYLPIHLSAQIDDSPMFVSIDTLTLDENDLETGVASVSGRAIVDFGNDGPGTIFPALLTVGGDLRNGILSAGQIPVVTSQTADGWIGVVNTQTVFSMVIDPGTGDYTYTQFFPLDHSTPESPDDIICFAFIIAAEDTDGDQATATLLINVQNGQCIGNSMTETITATDCDSVTVNDIVYNSSGTFVQMLSTALGCDSTLTIEVNVVPENLQLMNTGFIEAHVSAYNSIEIFPTFEVNFLFGEGEFTMSIFECPD